MRQKIIFLIFSSLILITCSLDDLDEIDHPILGNWKWIESSGGFSGDIRSPKTTGYSIELRLTKYKRYYEYRDNRLIIASSYEIIEDDIWGDDEIEEILIVEDASHEQIVAFIESDTLLLIENCMDCYQHKYIKK